MNSANNKEVRRLHSLDALRGFDMFWIMGGEGIFAGLAFFFVVIGVNPITIYLANRIINFGNAGKFLFGGLTEVMPETWTPLIEGIAITTIGWLFLYILYRKKIFPKI